MCRRLNLNHLWRLMFVSDYINALVSLDFFFSDKVFKKFRVFVSRQQMLLQKRLVAETSIAVSALRHFQVNLIVATERRFMTKGHKAGAALMSLSRVVNERVLLESCSIAEFFPTKFYDESKVNFMRWKLTDKTYHKYDL